MKGHSASDVKEKTMDKIHKHFSVVNSYQRKEEKRKPNHHAHNLIKKYNLH